ncbi:MAG: hypothetical protein ABI239_10210 [Aquihabitans sp.]
MKRSTAVALVIVVLAVTGCSGSSSDNGTATTSTATPSTTFTPGVTPTMPPGGEVDIDPCTLLSLEEAEAEFGAPLTTRDVGQQFPMVCAYTRPVDTEVGNPSEGVRLEIQTADVYNHVKDAQAANEEMGIVLTPVEGIGDDAYLQKTGPTFQLGFRRGDIAVYVKVDDSTRSDAETIEAMENLAALIVDRI